MMQIRICLGILALFVAACAPLPQRAGVPLEPRPSANFDERRPNFVILHYTSNADAERALRTLTDPLAKVSAHYLVARDGKIYQLVDEHARAWHAGVSYWGGERDVNSASLGIELDNDGEEPFAEPQIAALVRLLADIKERYAVPAANFLGHADVAPRRKADPGRRFPWQRLAAGGFGLWCEPPYAPASRGAGDALLLAAFGYDVSDPAAAISAFKTHFVADGDADTLTDEDRALLNCLIGKKQEKQSR
jgi:N-acetylmuramoyl-L-alanine amidase